MTSSSKILSGIKESKFVVCVLLFESLKCISGIIQSVLVKNCWIGYWTWHLNIRKIVCTSVKLNHFAKNSLALFQYLTYADVIPLKSSWDSILLLIRRAGKGDSTWCVNVCQCAPNPRGFLQSQRWHLNDRFPSTTQAICTCPFFCKGQQIGTSSHYNVRLWLGHNSATGLGHRGARSLALQEESGPEQFPGGLDTDSDVVPTVRCQQERGVRFSAWVWDVVCVWQRKEEKKQKVRVCVCVCVFARVLYGLCKVFLTQD